MCLCLLWIFLLPSAPHLSSPAYYPPGLSYLLVSAYSHVGVHYTDMISSSHLSFHRIHEKRHQRVGKAEASGWLRKISFATPSPLKTPKLPLSNANPHWMELCP